MTDPSRPRERTALAWQRSGLSLAAIGALMLREGLVGRTPVLAFVAAGALWLAALAVYVGGGVTGRLGGRSGVRALAGASLLAALLAAGIVLVSALR